MILWFWQENTFCDFDGKMRFCGFGRKHVFVVLAGKRDFAVLAGKCVFAVFTVFAVKCVLMGKAVLAGITFLRENCDFGQKLCFVVLAEKCVCSFGGKMFFYGFVVFHE